MIQRVYVEKKSPFQNEATSLLVDVKNNLKINSLRNIRLINVYDIEKIDENVFNASIPVVFAELPVDNFFLEESKERQEIENSICNKKARGFLYSYLPGQFDQRADSAVQCIKTLENAAEPKVRSAKLIFIEGEITDKEYENIKEYMINPVDSEEIPLGIPESLAFAQKKLGKVKIIDGFIDYNEELLNELLSRETLAMSLNDLKHTQKYFLKIEKRNPTITEIKVLDTYWSDHCRHTTFNTEIVKVDFDNSEYGHMIKKSFEEYLSIRTELYKNKQKPVSLMDIACIGAKSLIAEGKADKVDISEEVNACSINAKVKVEKEGKITEEDWLIMYKNETHNHPTEIEPFGGAATCLGGAIRDPLSGRAYVYQAMRVTGSADPRKPISETLAGKLPQRKITTEAAAGYSSYGNQIGLATGQVKEIYHPGYMAKR
ncbi:MAG: phosphoribosylformylglycinamidine synthase, partial [Anaerovoracaceae bacterium]